MNLQIKRPRLPNNEGIGSLQKANFQLHMRKITDKKTAYNEVRLDWFTKANFGNSLN